MLPARRASARGLEIIGSMVRSSSRAPERFCNPPKNSGPRCSRPRLPLFCARPCARTPFPQKKPKTVTCVTFWEDWLEKATQSACHAGASFRKFPSVSGNINRPPARNMNRRFHVLLRIRWNIFPGSSCPVPHAFYRHPNFRPRAPLFELHFLRCKLP